VRLIPGEGEPVITQWHSVPMDKIVEGLIASAGGRHHDRPLIVAIDGRGGAGKTTLVRRLLSTIPSSAALHTDDVAWHHPFFDWAQLLQVNVLDPLRRGDPVDFRPDAWAARDREGSIRIPAGLEVVWVEGTGSSRRVLSHLVDASVWIQADKAEAERRLVLRDGEAHELLRQEWEKEEVPFLLADQPWNRANIIVAGTPLPECIAAGHIAVA
jgi:hypothetical protein